MTGATAAVAASTAQAVRVNALPTVTLTAVCVAPCTNPATVNLTAAPADSDGTIAKVEFYDGVTLLTTKTATPWTYSHTTAATGSHSYSAKAFDNSGASAASVVQTVTVTLPPPTVSSGFTCITNPCTAPANITLTATPANIVGTVSKVELFSGATLVGQATLSGSNYVYNWINVAAGSYSVTARVTNSLGAQTTSIVMPITVNAAAVSSLNLQLSGGCMPSGCTAPATAGLAVDAYDLNGNSANDQLTKVEFYEGSTLLITKTSQPWTHDRTALAAGAHTFTAKGYDLGSLAAVTQALTITVVEPPSVTLIATCTQPCSAPATVLLTATKANATQTNGAGYSVYGVDMYDGGTWLGRASSTGVDQFTFTVTNLYGGSHSFNARLYTWYDNQTVATSSAVALSVTGTTLTLGWRPNLFIADNTALGAVVFSVHASVASGSVTGLKYYADGVFIGDAAVQGDVFAYTWHPPSGKASWQITATAIDDQGGSRTSAALELRAETTSAFKFIEAAPLSPVYVEQNGLGSVQLQVATDPSIVQIQGPSGLWDRSNMQAWTVDLFESGALVDTQRFGYENVATLPADPTSYQQAWQWNGGGYVVYRAPRPFVRSQLAPGTYTYTLQLTPNYGGTWRAAPFTVSVAAREPTIRISAPSANTSLYQGNVSVALEVSGPTPVTDAILKENGVEIGRCVVVSPNVSSGFYRTGSCTVRWLSASVGSHTLVANIGDSEGHAATSTPVTFSVLANARPAVSIDIPTYGARYRSPAQITVSGTATDVDGTVAQVRVKVDTLPIASVIPIQGGYSTSFALDSNGVSRPYNIDASAVDDRGAVSTSAQTSIMVLGTPTVSMSPYCGPCIEGRVYLNLQSNYAPEDSSAVRYFRDGQLIASLTSGVWLYTDRDALAGQHQYSAEITTRFTEIATSLPVNITVLAHSPPSVTMVTPTRGANFTIASAALELRASATQSDFAITRVEFLLNGATVLGQAQLSQGSYAFIWPTLSAVSAGTHQIRARATDERGYVAVSDPVSITVTAAIVSGPAAAAISFPVTGSEFPAAQAITVTAGGPSADPNITRIELWRVGTGAGGTDELLTPATGNALSSALTLPSATTSLGLYTIAVNAAGGRTQSATVTITVRADITDPRYFVWTNMNAALKAGNKAAALAYLTPTAQTNYSELFDDSIPQIAAIAASYLPTFVQTELTETTADYLVARTINGQRLIFALRFVRMDDGTWKLESI